MAIRFLLATLVACACLPLVAGDAADPGGGRGGRGGMGGIRDLGLGRMLGLEGDADFDLLAASTQPADQQAAVRMVLQERLRLLMEAARLRIQEQPAVVAARQAVMAAMDAYLAAIDAIPGIKELTERQAAAELAMREGSRDDRRVRYEELTRINEEREALIAGNAELNVQQEKLAAAEQAYLAALQAALTADAGYQQLKNEKDRLDRLAALERDARRNRMMRDFRDRMQRGGGPTANPTPPPGETPKPEGAKDF
jgi:hypothetical protein